LISTLPAASSGDRFSEHRIGLDHIAVGVHGRDVLEGLQVLLRDIGAETTGIHLDRAAELTMISFRDPDNIHWEFFEQE
jgi:glyoxylase I family protein